MLGELTGGGAFEALASHSLRIELVGRSFLCLGLDRLIHVKRAAGRPMVFDALAELEKLRELKGHSGG